MFPAEHGKYQAAQREDPAGNGNCVIAEIQADDTTTNHRTYGIAKVKCASID